MWKVISVDNYDREYIADRLHSDNYEDKLQAEDVCNYLNTDNHSERWYQVVPQDRKLWKGMEEFI